MIREGNSNESIDELFFQLKHNHPNDWLLSIEIAELLEMNTNQDLLPQVISHLESLKEKRPEVKKLISNGLDLIFNKN